MPQATSVKPTTCSNCPNFNNFHEPNGRGWCNLFDQQARKHHLKTNDCILSSLANSLEAFPSEVIELDRLVDELETPILEKLSVFVTKEIYKANSIKLRML
ncbi:MAG: hypothetical protein HC939_24020 [Pleurocapsa sp. SU_5_0]|nr:hypothetical protein [Pleurocapsa sp. SU_5_0]NJO96061.1 hypothetical protein [Pleurocapsa sp. CRU_1_2]